jgi:hypothetical protein
MFGGIFCLSFYCKKLNENLEEEVIIIKIKRSDIVDENGNPLNIPPQYTEIENSVNSNRDSEEIPLLQNEETNEEPNEEPPQYFSNGGSINQSRENRETNINSENINNSIYNTNINNVSTERTTSNIVYNNSLNDGER